LVLYQFINEVLLSYYDLNHNEKASSFTDILRQASFLALSIFTRRIVFEPSKMKNEPIAKRKWKGRDGQIASFYGNKWL
jgi:hypothetical protein